MSLRRLILFPPLLSCAMFAACSGGSSPAPSSAPAPTSAPQADKEAALYEQTRGSGSWDVALSLGNEVVAKFPGTNAAAQVQQSLADVRAKAQAQASQRRLSRLWTYTATPEAGGTQYAAAIASKNAPGASAYLLLDNAKFDCRAGCATLPVSFDGAPAQRMKATIPPTGEPALFIDDDKTFIAKVEQAQTVAISATIKDIGEQTMQFEVGGYDPAKLPQKPRK
jgi:hypothetical protein